DGHSALESGSLILERSPRLEARRVLGGPGVLSRNSARSFNRFILRGAIGSRPVKYSTPDASGIRGALVSRLSTWLQAGWRSESSSRSRFRAVCSRRLIVPIGESNR